jgi:hypothetical protein
VAPYGTVTDGEEMLGEIIANEVDGPAGFEVANVRWRLGQQHVKLLIERLSLDGRASRCRGIDESLDALTWVGFEPGAHGLFIAIESLGALGDPDSLLTEQDLMASLGNVRPMASGAFQLVLLVRGQGDPDHERGSRDSESWRMISGSEG